MLANGEHFYKFIYLYNTAQAFCTSNVALTSDFNGCLTCNPNYAVTITFSNVVFVFFLLLLEKNCSDFSEIFDYNYFKEYNLLEISQFSY